MKKKVKPDRVSSVETIPSLLTASANHVPQVDRADVERRFFQFCSTEQVASDLLWDQLGLNAWRYSLVYPLRGTLQALARKHFNQPRVFQQKFIALYERHLERLMKTRSGKRNIRSFLYFRQCVNNDLAPVFPTLDLGKAESDPRVLPRLPGGLSAKQLAAFDCLLDIWAAPFRGASLAETDPKKAIGAFNALTARPTGSPSQKILNRAYELQKSGKTADQICKALDLYPPSAKSAERKMIRQRVLSGCQYRRKKASGVREYRS